MSSLMRDSEREAHLERLASPQEESSAWVAGYETGWLDQPRLPLA